MKTLRTTVQTVLLVGLFQQESGAGAAEKRRTRPNHEKLALFFNMSNRIPVLDILFTYRTRTLGFVDRTH